MVGRPYLYGLAAGGPAGCPAGARDPRERGRPRPGAHRRAAGRRPRAEPRPPRRRHLSVPDPWRRYRGTVGSLHSRADRTRLGAPERAGRHPGSRRARDPGGSRRHRALRGRRLRRRGRPRPSPQRARRLSGSRAGRRADAADPAVSRDVEPRRPPSGAPRLAGPQPRRARARARLPHRSRRASSPRGASAARGLRWTRCARPWSRFAGFSPASSVAFGDPPSRLRNLARRRRRSTSSPRARAWWSSRARWPTAPS